MIEYPTHTWPQVVAEFISLAEAEPSFLPLSHAVEQLASSAYASGLCPVKAMHTLQLYQLDRFQLGDERLLLSYENGAFVVRHLARGTPDPLLSLQPVGGWTKRGPDALSLLARAFHHLRWFVEYDGTVPAGGDRAPAV